MADHMIICFMLISLFAFVVQASLVSTGNFNEDFHINWSPDHVNTSTDGHSTTLKLDYSSGSGVGSNNKFIFGQYDMQIKLAPGVYSADVCVTFYLQSEDGATRDEIDFEFLGHVTGQPWTLQTNVYTNGHGEREQRIYLWFDPTEDFHIYSILWNIHQLVFMVDWKPIRVFENLVNEGGQYPTIRPMDLMASIWNANWTTGGGDINWSYAPFVASYKDYKIDACVCNNGCDINVCSAVSETNWWNKDEFKSLTEMQRAELKWVRENVLNYDYCQDIPRLMKSFGTIPRECSLPRL
ncbi:unnamed protein product [Rhodiola kirilowii]